MSERTGKVGIREVARAAGVSVTTVSHALSGARAVSPATRARIEQVVRELGYAPDWSARGLRSRRTGLVGLLGDVVLTTPYAGRLVLGAQEALDEHDMTLVAVDTGADAGREERAVRSLLHRQVEGIVYARMYHQEVVVPPSLAEVPVVVANASPTGDGVREVPWVVPDEVDIARLAVGHLLEHGHRRVAFAQTEEVTPASVGRERGYRETLAAAGLPVNEELVVRDAPDAAGGRRTGLGLLEKDPPTAVFCFNDQIAMGVLQAAQRRGVAVPHDLSVVGVDDLLLVAEALDPGLTTVALPHEEMGRWAAERLLATIEEPGRAPEGVRLRCRLVERGSVAGPA